MKCPKCGSPLIVSKSMNAMRQEHYMETFCSKPKCKYARKELISLEEYKNAKA